MIPPNENDVTSEKVAWYYGSATGQGLIRRICPRRFRDGQLFSDVASAFQ
jgi:hypothetical protein